MPGKLKAKSKGTSPDAGTEVRLATEGQMVVEPISASIGILASVLSIAASVKQLVQKRHISKQDALQIYLRQASDKERKLLQRPDIQAAVLEVTVISKALLDQLAKEAQECERKHIRERQEADRKNNQTDKVRADVNAAQCMCNVLRDIKRYNTGQLPKHGPFLDWWDSYDCSN